MTELQLRKRLNSLNLMLVRHSDENYAVGRKGIGNPLLFFNPKYKGLEYSGTIHVKACNIVLYNSSQVYSAIELVNDFLFGELVEDEVKC